MGFNHFSYSHSGFPFYHNNNYYTNAPSYQNFALNAQLGGITMWNRYFGLQYYYDLNLNVDNIYEGIIATNTFNLDMVLNAYNSDNFGIGFTLGLGAGFDLSYYDPFTVISLDTRLNLGLRFIIKSNYAISLNFDVPFFGNYVNLCWNNYGVSYDPLNFSINFVYGKF